MPFGDDYPLVVTLELKNKGEYQYHYPFGVMTLQNNLALESLFPVAHRSVRHIPAPDLDCEVELRGRGCSQGQLLSLPASFGNE